MNIYNELKNFLDFFIQPFLSLLDDIGISDTTIKMGFGSIEWFEITLYNLVYFIIGSLLLYLFFRFIFRILKRFIKLITGGNYL